MFIFHSWHRSFIRSFVHSFIMSTSVESVTPDSVVLHLERKPPTSEEYWPLTIDAVNACDISFLNDKWSEDMVKDGMRSIIRVGQLPEMKNQEINVWKHLSEYSPSDDRGFMFSYGDDRIVTLVGDNMETGHSGASMGWTMRQIEFIAKNGIPAYRERFLRRNN